MSEPGLSLEEVLIDINKRLESLEKHSHPPVNFTPVVEELKRRIRQLEITVVILK